MLKKLRIVLLMCVLASATAMAQRLDHTWKPDILGRNFENMQIQQPDDYSGKVVSTVIRRLADCPSGGRAVLYVHGFNDYFFQSEMADSFAAHAIDFYAVDLRRYGRSILPGQRMFDVRNLNEYFQDIDSALSVMKAAGTDSVILMGHSTGGLITSYYMARQPSPMVSKLILNSPFLDWNLGKLERWIWAVDLLGAIAPNMKISQGDSDAYSSSLLKDKHGEWDYRKDWKLSHSPDVTAGWVRAIDRAQNYLHNHVDCIHVPILLMYSAKSYSGNEWTPEANQADAVLDVNDIRHYGLLLGNDVQPVKVVGGLHDLMLSVPGVRAALYPFIFRWLGAPKCSNSRE